MCVLPHRSDAVLDSKGMWSQIASLPEQVERATALSAHDQLPDLDEIDEVVILALEDSGVAGELIAAIARPFGPVPVVCLRRHELPPFIDDSTLLFALSLSGDSEAVIDVTSEAALQGAKVVVISQGGELARLARSWAAPHLGVPEDIPLARVGLGALSIPALVALEEIGLFPGAHDWISEAVSSLKERRDSLVRDDATIADIARAISGTIPLVYGAGDIGSVASLGWKTSINQNAKMPAFAGALPELLYDELDGWGQLGDVTRQVFSLVCLRHGEEHPSVSNRFARLPAVLGEIVHRTLTVEAMGDGSLAQCLDLLFLGDLVSLYLARDAGVDPGNVTALDLLDRS